MAKLIVMHPFHSFSAAEAMEVLWRRWTWNMSEVRFVWICTDCRTAEAHWEYISLFRSNLVYATALCQSSERAMYKVWFYQLILCSFAKGAYNHHSRALPQFERKQRMARTTTAKYWKQRSEYGRGGARRKTNVSTSSAVNYYMALASLMLNVDAHTVRRTPWLITPTPSPPPPRTHVVAMLCTSYNMLQRANEQRIIEIWRQWRAVRD